MMHQLLFLKTRRIAKVSFFWDHSHYMCKCSSGFPPRKEASNWLSTKIACSFFGRKPLELISWLESVKKLTLVLFLTLPHEIILLHFLHSQFSYFWNFGLIFSYLIQNSGHINRHEEHWFMEWENQVSDFFSLQAQFTNCVTIHFRPTSTLVSQLFSCMQLQNHFVR